MVVAVVEIHHGDMTGRGDQLEQTKWKMYRVLCMENSELGFFNLQMAARTFEITRKSDKCLSCFLILICFSFLFFIFLFLFNFLFFKFIFHFFLFYFLKKTY